jgi:ATP-dependent Clp protease protease subunit
MAEHEEDLVKNLQEKNLELNLYKDRKIFLWSQVDNESAKAIVMRLLSLEVEKPGEEIVFFINSPGGSVSDGLAIYDTMQAISSPVSTVCVGLAASMGAMLLCAGTAGRRFAWPHARIMIHQPSMMGTITGPSTDLEIHAREIVRSREELNRLMAQHCDQDLERIAKDTDRDNWMTAAEAKEYGLVDDVITTTVPEAAS